jgi:hypothetical protein
MRAKPCGFPEPKGGARCCRRTSSKGATLVKHFAKWSRRRPHVEAMQKTAVCLYGGPDRACKILHGPYEASRYVESQRLPELFRGFHKRPEASGPTLYPVACAPQAWAAGSVFLLLQACLGLKIRAHERQIRFVNPSLPSNLDEVRIENLSVGDAVADLLIRRDGSVVAVEVLRKHGDLEIVEPV